jgi:beta-glucosidase
MIRNGLAILILLCGTGIAFAQETPLYRNRDAAIEDRVADLLRRMTLEERIDQISGGRHNSLLDTTGRFKAEDASKLFGQLHGIDSTFTPRETAVLRNAAQRFQLEKTRLGIPALFMGEALHGFMQNGATSFPQAIALAGTWDPELVQEVFAAAADEMSSAGVRQAFTPVLDLARDPRWGRTEETYGEDPYLVSRIGIAAIRGMQGRQFRIDGHHVLATAKHFAVHGQPESGTNTAPGNYSERIVRENFFVPFQAAIQEGKAGSVMASYNEIDGIPSHINHWLLEKVLRQEWGFQGYVTSDGDGLQMLVETHHVAADKAQAARKALAAGVDYDLSDGSVYQTLLDQVRQGTVPTSELDIAVARILTAKFRLGLFDDTYVDPDYAERVTNSAEHRKLALRSAEKAIVLLKNANNLLPLDVHKIKSIAVLGPNAADVHLGGYSREPAHGVSILEGVRSRVGPGVKVLYAAGCQITSAKQGWRGWYEDNVKLADAAAEAPGIREAAELARQADVAVVVVGENESTNREAWSQHHLGDRDSLELLGAQNDLIKAVVATGKPTIVFLINGRPLTINDVVGSVPAILEGWYLGQEGGTAAAEALFGDINPGGKLPITFPRSVGQLPDYYNHKPSMNRSYAFTSRTPLFPFGFGLSYTTFRFSNLKVEPAQINAGGSATVSVDIANTGSSAGDEVAQLYIHQRVASVTRPVLQLRGFRRITLKAGETSTITLVISPADLTLLDVNMNSVVEPGIFDLMVGPNSAETASVPLTVHQIP